MAMTQPRPKIYDVAAPDAIQMALAQLMARQQRAQGVVNRGTLGASPMQRSLASMVGGPMTAPTAGILPAQPVRPLARGALGAPGVLR